MTVIKAAGTTRNVKTQTILGEVRDPLGFQQSSIEVKP